MENWVFALIVLGFGVFLAILVDRMRARTRVPGANRSWTDKEREKSKWLSYWYTGRFPSKEDLDREEEEAGAEDEAADDEVDDEEAASGERGERKDSAKQPGKGQAGGRHGPKS